MVELHELPKVPLKSGSTLKVFILEWFHNKLKTKQNKLDLYLNNILYLQNREHLLLPYRPVHSIRPQFIVRGLAIYGVIPRCDSPVMQ